MTGNADLILDVKNLHLTIGGLQILKNVSFAMRENEFFAVIGPNGAGKTSLLNILSRLYKATSGEVSFAGQKLLNRRPSALAGLGIARTFQNLALFEHMDVLDNIVLGRHHLLKSGVASGSVWFGRARNEEREARAVCEPLIELLDLGRYLNKPVGDLPYGIKKRIEFGRALAMRPKLILLDEPAAGMNDEETDELSSWIVTAKKELSLSVLMIEHDMALVTRLADRALVLDFGEVICCEDPSIAIADPRVVSAYLGDPVENKPEDTSMASLVPDSEATTR
ncbi:ABC transporter ATP-binding protein [Pseudarthrobacter sp. NPDC058329]|uniref:ABC transporter ATP-binding protein n=1 Tax=Pseudarthrobacter sp. NPDC058329 TaxID=3346448 RepID=UPI0036D8D553